MCRSWGGRCWCRVQSTGLCPTGSTMPIGRAKHTLLLAPTAGWGEPMGLCPIGSKAETLGGGGTKASLLCCSSPQVGQVKSKRFCSMGISLLGHLAGKNGLFLGLLMSSPNGSSGFQVFLAPRQS